MPYHIIYHTIFYERNVPELLGGNRLKPKTDLFAFDLMLMPVRKPLSGEAYLRFDVDARKKALIRRSCYLRKKHPGTA